jgi:hypothetical protein
LGALDKAIVLKEFAMNTRLFVGAMGLLAIGAAGLLALWLANGRSMSTRSVPSSNETSLALAGSGPTGIQHPRKSLKASPDHQRGTALELDSASESTFSGESARKPPPSRSPEQIREARREALERLVTIDRSFELESRDNSWASETETIIEGAFAALNAPNTTLLSADCKSSFCRVEATHKDHSSRSSFELIKRAIPGNYYIQQIDPEDRGGDGHYKTVAYFVRKGHEDRNALYDVMYARKATDETVR